MPLVPSVLQTIFGDGSICQTGMDQPQGSPTRYTPPGPPNAQVQRQLPTPPHPVPQEVELPPPKKLHTPSPRLINPSQPQPRHGVPILAKIRALDANFQLTDQLLAEMEIAGGHLEKPGPHPHSSAPSSFMVGPSTDEGDHLARISNSPKDHGDQRGQPRQDQPQYIMSPRTNRDLHPTALLGQFAQARTPEIPSPTAYHTPLGSPGEKPAAYANFSPRHPAAPRLPVGRLSPTQMSPRHGPTLRSPRSPDRSLPVQEELEDVSDEGDQDFHEHKLGSPTPSSDLNPHGTNNGRESRNAHRDDDETLLGKGEYQPQQSSSSEEDGSFTPRSAVSSLPDPHAAIHYLQQQIARSRGGVTDHLGLQGLDAAIFDSHDERVLDRPPPQYVDPRGQVHTHQYSYPPSQYYPEELAAAHQYLDEYMVAYMTSPRPDAPIPPTSHSQTTSSPSPLTGTYDPRHPPPFSPVPIPGSPYPFPYSHVRRNVAYSSGEPSVQSTNPPRVASQALDPKAIHESLVKQWQIYASNSRSYPPSESTLSPSSTPLQPGMSYNPWAQFHTSKILGVRRGEDTRSMQSSPSHEPVPLPPPPHPVTRKKEVEHHPLRQSIPRPNKVVRKPPPRVQSTQPRDTSPEPVSDSGDDTSTAGEMPFEQTEPHFAIVEEGAWVNGTFGAPPSKVEEDEWVDEDEDGGDEEDLLELEYHPSFVGNVEKRRRRWDSKWEGLIQAVCKISLFLGGELDC